MSFLCPRCNRISYHPQDELHGYCGGCHDWTALKAGDVLRIRPAGSDDEWCVCQVQLASTNGQSLALIVTDGGMLRPRRGGFITGMIAVLIDPLRGPYEVFTNTDLDIEGRADQCEQRNV